MMGVPTLTFSGLNANSAQPAVGEHWPKSQGTSQLTIFCDLDGPLIDVSQRYYKTYQLALAETQAYISAQEETVSLIPLSLDQFWTMKQSKRPDVEIAHLSGLSGHWIDFFMQQVQAIVNQPLLLQEDRLQPGVHQALEHLLNQGAQLVVVTLRCQDQVEHVLYQHQLARYFRLVRGTDDTQAAYKNYAACKQALIQDAINAMGLTHYEQIWMIGDTEADVLAAQAMKIKTIALTCGMRNYAFLESLRPTRIQSNLPTAVRELTVAP
ncbi:HAD hydrolase-like protein [Acaryochloris sp. IP29b_bin.137]|uniref:HAD family hydrolase n=1 Tax=Acaryochloris sp. IP29b_bin.137 TaxID=2969217 RepID=UPI002611D82D|nr:HAD hydrolase-like protein [Acaryochloris sp. IP29b_bin.137]